MITIANYIGGKLVAPAAGRYLDDIEPATGRPYALVPESDAVDLEAAVAAARGAFLGWARQTVEERSRLLLRIAEGIEVKAEALARAESIDTGKPIGLARQVDIPRAAANFRFFAHAVTQFASESHGMGTAAINYTLRDPLGVVACLSPWNLPLYLLSWKIAPALAAGNAVIAKPSELAPMTAYWLGRICMEAGLPRGVLNIVHGSGPSVGQALVAHPAIKAISFTGGTKTGAAIASVAAPQFKKLSLELGGKNPTILFADCNWEQALDGALRAAFANQGEVCLCGSRIFVERSIYEPFKRELVARAEGLRLGDPLSEDTEQGALVTEAHLEKVLSYVQLAREEGGRILTGGVRVTVPGRCEAGYFVKPAIVEGLTHECRTNREEIFGPVACLLPFDDEDEVLAEANGTEFGLAASVWTRDLQRGHRIAQRLDSGVVWVNTWLLRDLRTPFGGMKHSGVGREGGFETMRFFTEAKNVCIKL
ncbi:MAG: aldehyde dehydrogenase [Pseudomonadota bacterium]|nr:aldehyde dehydrogenase [Pseudomonadota bacterium]